MEETDVGRARELREALRALLAANNGAPVEETAVATLNEVAARARLGVRFGRGGRYWRPPPRESRGRWAGWWRRSMPAWRRAPGSA